MAIDRSKVRGEWFLTEPGLNDQSGNGRNATATFTPSYVDGPVAGTKAVAFSATSQRVSFGRTGLEPTAADRGVTTMAWVYVPTGAGSSYSGLVHKLRTTGGSTRAGFQLNGDNFRPLARWKDSLQFSDNAGNISGAWHHLAVVDGDTRWAWYIDGVQISGGTRSLTTATSPTWEAFDWVAGWDSDMAQSRPGVLIHAARILAGELTTAEVGEWMGEHGLSAVEPTGAPNLIAIDEQAPAWTVMVGGVETPVIAWHVIIGGEEVPLIDTPPTDAGFGLAPFGTSPFGGT